MEQGAISKPLKGETGCYVVQLESKSIPAVDGANLAAEKNNLKVPFDINAAIEDLKEDAGIKDSRYLFY